VEEFAALPPDTFNVALAAIGASAAPTVAGLTGVALPSEPDAVAAKVIAARDPDVLIDLAGLAAASGPLLALRPARSIWTIGALPLPNRVPLVDRTFTDTTEAMTGLLQLQRARDPSRECPLDVATLDASWQNAVRTHQSGDRAAAIAHYKDVLGLQPGFATALFLSGVARRDEGDIAGAREAFVAAVAAAPGYIDARIAAARAALTMHDAQAAIALCEDGLARSPADARLWRALGDAQLVQHDGAAAATAFATALRINANDGEGHYSHGVALQMQGELSDASRAYQRALALRPDLTAAHFNLGVLFQMQGATDAAIAAYGEVLSADPRNVAAYKNLGEVLHAAGRIDAWLANFRRFEARCPNALPLAVQALEACQHLADFATLERYLNDLAEERFVAEDDAQLVDSLEELLYLLLFFDVPVQMIERYSRIYDEAARRVYGEPLPRPVARTPRRLRIGYLSADFRDHVMGKMIWSAIEHHDKTRFELYFYALSAVTDDWTVRFRGLADHFEILAGRDERAAAARIADDDLDILVDLSTHTKGAKPGILALKPARVQVTHVASAGTVGLSTIDFKLTDRFCDLPDAQAFQIETLLPMDGCVYPYRHVAPSDEHSFHRAALGIADDTIVIGAFVAGLKLSRRCLALWRDVLARVPRAKLAFSPVNPVLVGMYERLAAAAGITRNRLLFVPQGRTEAENRARYALVDFVLDPVPFGGVNGTLEALDMGVPVVTLLGRRHGERTSYSILANLGVTETVAASGREYVDLAARLADDAAFMRDVRSRIRAGLERSVLTDMPAHTRSLERAYIAALETRAPEVLADVERSRDG
jgi:predicted O-linked N-acetylglucosamine transferase (SPINDLY family)